MLTMLMATAELRAQVSDGSCSHVQQRRPQVGKRCGIGGRRAAILEDNILCTSRDPYYHHLSVLVHEYTTPSTPTGPGPGHAPQRHGISTPPGRPASGRSRRTPCPTSGRWPWPQPSSSGSTATDSTPGRRTLRAALCQTEQEGRMRLRERDPALFQILAQVFTEDNANLTSLMGPLVQFKTLITCRVNYHPWF
ncbi:hypothetical protein Btru_065309 [Bulinus truncatus]|nr:hypothetical protein Btru_065309 [Bulinus truncatus]